jgi:hypothetical protein
MVALNDLTGQRFGRLTVLARAPSFSEGASARLRTAWHARCACGQETTVRGKDLTSGAIRSCGCLGSEVKSKKATTHGYSHKGMSEYSTWVDIRKRCRSPNSRQYRDYGGRGISICERWAKFENFLADIGRKPSPKHTIERINNDGPYAPWNCHWGATRRQQNNNKRNNRRITINGRTQTVAQWALEANISYGLLHSRLQRRWRSERLLLRGRQKPVKKQQPIKRKDNHFISLGDTTLTITEWARRLRTSGAVLRGRIKRGWPVERLLTPPRHIKRGKFERSL